MTSIAVVVLDTLRYDCFQRYFSWLDGLWFENAYSTSHWTSPAHASLLTGRYPSEVGVTIDSRSLMTERTRLPELLQRAGYRTRMVTDNMQIAVWDGWQRGFEQCIGPRTRNIHPVPDEAFDWAAFADSTDLTGARQYIRGLWECVRRGNSLSSSIRFGYQLKVGNQRSSEVIRDRLGATEFGNDEFLLVNAMDVHKPYEHPFTSESLSPQFEKGLTGSIEDPDAIRASYDACAAHLSTVYRDIFARLQEDFDYIITLADHGESLGERDLWTHTYGLGQEVTRVPLVISGDGVDSESVDSVVSLLDVHRTIADLAGVGADSRGKSLLDGRSSNDQLIEYHGLSDERRPSFEEQGIGDRFGKMDCSLDAIASADGYAEETYEGELRVSGEWTEAEARDRLDALAADRDRISVDREDRQLTDELQDHLENLGYR